MTFNIWQPNNFDVCQAVVSGHVIPSELWSVRHLLNGSHSACFNKIPDKKINENHTKMQNKFQYPTPSPALVVALM